MAAKQVDAEVVRRSNYRTIPKNVATVAVTASSASTGSVAAYLGQYVWLRAVTLDITIALGARTVVAGQGLVIPTDQYVEVYVDPGDDTVLSHISTGNATLVVLYD